MGPKVAGVILAGGRSSRLGLDKSLMPLRDRPLITWVADVLRPITGELIVVTNEADKFTGVLENVRFVQDALPVGATLVGIYSGLLAAFPQS
jgi:molybdopterin-guanine dinucleotide biosynthesis protein A